ncbi:hypothetical protein PsorP6_013261 [Peronosclerospora sorghi]|uniref:Uncharacterized protein n=1 Tax=Peronosclerospora sorghi TaxID=230839 RepID=A0ACC0WGX4_9STRA|nr:hypothetical protein PsorP6_013261 [Peronosclerospora sorghi]
MKVEYQSFGPSVQDAREQSTKMKMKGSVGHGSKLIVPNVKMDRSTDSLRALIDTDIADSSGDILASDCTTRSQSESVESSDEGLVLSQVKTPQSKLEEVAMSESVQLTCRDPSSGKGSSATRTPEQGMRRSLSLTKVASNAMMLRENGMSMHLHTILW